MIIYLLTITFILTDTCFEIQIKVAISLYSFDTGEVGNIDSTIRESRRVVALDESLDSTYRDFSLT